MRGDGAIGVHSARRQGVNQGLFRLIFIGVIGGAAVWVFAVIGFVTVASTIGTPGVTPSPPAPLLAPRDVVGLEVPDLPRYSAAARVDYRVDTFADVTLTDIEYRTEAAPSAVRRHYVSALEEHGWDVLDQRSTREGWSVHVALGRREATLVVAATPDGTEIELRLMEPAHERGRAPVR